MTVKGSLKLGLMRVDEQGIGGFSYFNGIQISAVNCE